MSYTRLGGLGGDCCPCPGSTTSLSPVPATPMTSASPLRPTAIPMTAPSSTPMTSAVPLRAPVTMRTSPGLQASMLPARPQPQPMMTRQVLPSPGMPPITIVPVTQTQTATLTRAMSDAAVDAPLDLQTKRNALIVGGLLALVVAGGVTYWLVKKKGS